MFVYFKFNLFINFNIINQYFSVQVYFNRYLAKIGIIKPTGSVNIATGSNLFYIKLLMNTKTFSIVNIDFKIFELNGIKVQTSGLWGPVDWFLSQVATCLAGHMKSDVIRGVEAEIKLALDKYIKDQKSIGVGGTVFNV